MIDTMIVPVDGLVYDVTYDEELFDDSEGLQYTVITVDKVVNENELDITAQLSEDDKEELEELVIERLKEIAEDSYDEDE